jgi:hypothetical protein
MRNHKNINFGKQKAKILKNAKTEEARRKNTETQGRKRCRETGK